MNFLFLLDTTTMLDALSRVKLLGDTTDLDAIVDRKESIVNKAFEDANEQLKGKKVYRKDAWGKNVLVRRQTKRLWTDPAGFRKRIIRRWWAALRLTHSLLQVYYFSSHEFVRPVRVLLLCVVLFTQMIVSAFLFNIKYGGSEKAPLSDTILFAFVSAAVTVPVTQAFVAAFSYTGKGRYITLLYERLAAAEDEVATNRGTSISVPAASA